MKDLITEVVFVLDRSGSMYGMESDTIGGFNSVLEKQKKNEGKAYITTVLFDDQYELLHDHIELNSVEGLTKDDYCPRGSTALYDAVGLTINKIGNIVKRYEKENVVFVIITDGLENSSSEFTRNQISRMISEKQEKGWEFVFLGANIDAKVEAENIGIKRSHAATFHNDSAGMAVNFCALNKMVSKARSCEALCEADFDEINEDFNKR